MKKLQAGDVIRLLAKKQGTVPHKNYLVISAKMDGGGTGYGPHDLYPDGWELTLKLLNDMEFNPKARNIYLFQGGFGGCFIPEVVLKHGEYEVVGKMKMDWTEV